MTEPLFMEKQAAGDVQTILKYFKKFSGKHL